MLRNLVSIRIIEAINPIDGADAIEVAKVGGWSIVVKKDEFKVGELAVYFEIDSFLPESDSRYEFLMKNSVRVFEDQRGHKLRTVKLRGQLSQGLLLPLKLFPEIAVWDGLGWEINIPLDQQIEKGDDTVISHYLSLSDWSSYSKIPWWNDVAALDFSGTLGIKKWDQPMPAELGGTAKGYFPDFIRKTDQERCQNLVPQIFGRESHELALSISLEEAAPGIASGSLRVENGVVYAVHKAIGDINRRYEVTIKLDGTSCTFYQKDGELGVCSRNLDLDLLQNPDNTLVKLFFESNLATLIRYCGNIAIQGEVMGPGIQGNRENLKAAKFFVFDVYNIDEQRYFTPEERRELMDKFANLLQVVGLELVSELVCHVPVLMYDASLVDLNISDVHGLLTYAEGPSLVNPVREGLVFKSMDGKFSFKAISNKYLLKKKE